MKIYIVGITGMLGSRLFKNFLKLKKYNVRGSLRNYPNSFKKYSKFIDSNCDVNDLNLIKRKLKNFNPDIVINCVGVIKQKINKDKFENKIFYLNSVFPHELYKITNLINSKLIHFSTDCVFDGKKGKYSESDKTNSLDIYGLSKTLGEINYPQALTLRTSIIGHEITNKLGLLEWFLSQKKKCYGFSRCFFSGYTTNEIFNILIRILNKKNLNGIYHLSSSRISKYHLLKLISKIYNKRIKIIRDEKLKIDRSLNSSRIKKLINYKSPSWNALILDMYNNNGKIY